jgi:hypothetical protein
MKVFRSFAISIVTSISLLSPVLANATCKGNACNYITVKKRGGCIVLENSHDKQAIKVSGLRTMPTYVWTVYARSEEIPKDLNGTCFKDWYSLGHSAVFQ